jgi:putative endopeptidase
MRKYLSAVLILFFAACQPTEKKQSDEAADPIDLKAIDSTVRPQDNFFLYANGGWLKNVQIPASQSGWGSFFILADSSLARMHTLLDSLAQLSNTVKNTTAQQVADLYFSAMDSAGIGARGWQPVKPELDSITAITDVNGLLREIAKEYAINHVPFFNFYVSPDERNSALYAAHFDQGGLGLPNRDYYFNQDSSIQKIRNAYKQLATKFFELSGSDAALAGKQAASVLALETAMAKASKSPVQLRDPVANYNKIPVSKLNAIMPGWTDLLHYLMVNADTVIVGQPAYFKELGVLLHKTPLADIKNYLWFHVMFDDAPYLSDAFVNARFDYSKMLNGQKVMKERWKRMISMVDEQLGDALGQLYVAKYFPPEAKERMIELVNNLENTYAERIQQLDWMSDSTKQKALLKLRAIVKKIGYPDKWKDYSTINIVRDDIIANIRQTSNYEFKRALNKIGKPVDRTEWYVTPPTIDAYYDPTQNNINFPAGILQPPFFYLHGDDALNYGGIGFVIGHEITHGFDDQGRQFDANGNMKDWWTAADATKFKQRASNIINQYNGYIAIDTFHINGALTEGENLADNGGLAISYAAFKKTAQGKSNVPINGLTPDQRFFLSAANVWRIKNRDESVRTQVMTNPHSTPMYRVNGPVSNMPAFYEAFHVKPTDPMYRADSIRVKVW